MADWYVDKSNGSDANAGTAGDPFENIQAAFVAASSGDTIHVANTAAQSGTFNMAAITRNSGDPVRVTAWDNGGSITLTLPNGTTRVAWEYDGLSTRSTLNVPGESIIEGLKAHDIDDPWVLTTPGPYTKLFQCEFYNSEGGGLDIHRAIVDDCCVHGVASGSPGVQLDVTSTMLNCKVDGGGSGYHGILISTSNTNTQVSCCVVKDFVNGIFIVDPACSVTHCTIDNCTYGVFLTSNSRGDLVSHNLITNCTTGIYNSGVQPAFAAKNAFFGNATNINLNSQSRDLGANIFESADPYVDADSDDYRIVSTAAIASLGDLYGAKPIAAGGGGTAGFTGVGSGFRGLGT